MAKTILVADDSVSVRLAVRMLLQNRHGELFIREALDGADAIEKARKLLDFAKPELNRAISKAAWSFAIF